MSLTDKIVPGEGRVPCRAMLVGEAPGQEEASRGRPFVGKTGKEQDAHLERNGLSRREFYITNLRKTFIPGNPAPTPKEIERWGPVLEAEIARVKPKFILAVGTHAVRYFLGDVQIDAVHGIPHRVDRPHGSVTILPGYHPAAHFYAPDLLQFICYDYARAAAALKGDIPLLPPTDQFPDPTYVDGDDRDLDMYADLDVLALDTEGIPGEEWSFQVSGIAGTGVVVRKENPRFGRGLKAFRRLVKGKTLVGHNLLYELEMFAALGVDLFDPALKIRPFDTMMAAYLHRLEPQSLKNLARRHCGMVMKDYLDTVGAAGRQKQLDYLHRVWEAPESLFPKPEGRVEHHNDGTNRIYKPQPIQRRAEAILIDVYSGKVNKDGEPVDPVKRWKDVDREQRLAVEARLGHFPIGTLADISLDEAVYYSARDPDATLRVKDKLAPSLKANNLGGLMAMKMAMYPAAAEMKLNGFMASRKHFEWLAAEMTEQMDIRASKISRQYFGGRPFNPNSPDQVATLMRRRGLEGEKKTKSGKVSTSKKSIEHLRFVDDSIRLVEEWREHQKVRDSFCSPILDKFPYRWQLGRTDPNPEVQEPGRRADKNDEGLPVHRLRKEVPLLRNAVRSREREEDAHSGLDVDAREKSKTNQVGNKEVRSGVRELSHGARIPETLEILKDQVDFARISGDLKMTRVSSGRFSMADPNLMAIPVRTRLGLVTRQGFVAEEGYVLGTWDLDQVEMRVMADESRDARLCKLFNDGKLDIHTDTASRIFGIPYDKVHKMDHRYPAKRAGFGIITGIQGPGLFDQLRMAGCAGWSVEKCDRLIRDWLKLFPGVKYYMEACGEECYKQGGVIFDRWGMPCYLPGIMSDDRYERFEARRQSHSHKIQGGAQGLLQNAMGYAYKKLKPYGDAVRWILQIHDELILEVAIGMEDIVNDIMVDALCNHGAKLRVPIKSKGSYGPNWALLEK